jgi:Rhs element Vgr protein
MSLTSLPPGTDDAKDVVSQTILIDGTPLSNEIELAQITVNKTFNKIASAKVVLLDGSASDRDFPLSDGELFKPGNTITIQLGYHQDVDTVFEGIIVKHAIKARQNGSSVLVIEAKDEAIKLTAARKSAYYINQTDSSVIEAIASEFAPEVDSTSYSHPQLIQFESTDWDFICTRAEANGMLVLTDDGTLVVKKPSASDDAVLTATYGDNIFEFEAEMDARRQPESVDSASWDYTKQELEESEFGSADFDEAGDLSSDDLGGVLGGAVTLDHPGHLTPDQLQAWSDAVALRSQLSKAVGRVRIEGNAEVKPGSVITLDGVGDRFNGDVLVTGVLHTYDGNWLTDIQFGWSDDWFYTKENVMQAPASGLLPGVSGLQIGLVLDTDDSKVGQYRVKVHVPTITSGKQGLWARVATLDAGAKRGAYFRPQPNDEVVLGFLGSDPREPIILGYLHSKGKHESPLPEEEGKEQFGFVTKAGLKLVFDDSNKRISLVVPSGAAGKKTITVNNDSGALEFKDENQNTIKMDKSGITIQSSKIVTIKGAQVKIN